MQEVTRLVAGNVCVCGSVCVCVCARAVSSMRFDTADVPLLIACPPTPLCIVSRYIRGIARDAFTNRTK